MYSTVLLYSSYTLHCFFFIHCPMSCFIRLLAVLSLLLTGQSISPRLGIHSTGMKHEGIKKHRRLNTSTTELNCCGKMSLQVHLFISGHKMSSWNQTRLHWTEAKRRHFYSDFPVSSLTSTGHCSGLSTRGWLQGRDSAEGLPTANNVVKKRQRAALPEVIKRSCYVGSLKRTKLKKG